MLKNKLNENFFKELFQSSNENIKSLISVGVCIQNRFNLQSISLTEPLNLEALKYLCDRQR